MSRLSIRFLVFLVVAVVAAACGGSSTEHDLVSAETAFDLVEESADGLVVLDIRTPEEFDDARIEGSVLIDFYDIDFADQLDGLDKDVPYLVYCRSGNRSAQAMPVFEDLGFTVIHELDGGIVAWADAGLPLATS